jgi:NitT/TauT family transport system ATP-binding protein
MPSLRAEGISKRFREGAARGGEDQQLVVLDNLSVEFYGGQLTSLYGPNGCGKSTLLDILAGNQHPDAGNVIQPESRNQVGFVWQDFRSAIFPWLSVAQNIAMAETINDRPKAAIDQAAIAALAALDIRLPLDKKARDLSGGQQQMVCIARLVASNSSVIFLDEPFSAIDERNKYVISRRLRQWTVDNGKTALMVTHNLDESILLGDRLLILSDKPMSPIQDITIQLENRNSADTLSNREFASIRAKAFGAVSQWIK